MIGVIFLKKKIWDSILISVLVTLVTAGLALLFTDTESAWYISLNKPSFQPPGWVFGVVWSIVYTLYAVSLTFAQLKDVPKKTYILYALQALLNVLWCLFFFTLHMPYTSLVIILAYLVVTYLTIRNTYSYSKIASLVLIPQGIWLIIATVLNYMIILLN